MENIVNCYELDFVKDIPEELIQLKHSCLELRETNITLKIALTTLLLGIGAYTVYQILNDASKEEQR